MHYCFFTAGSWESNASFVRLREFGAQMLRRGGARVSYLLDDLPFNRAELSLHPQAERHFTPNPRSIGQITARRRIIRQLAPDFVHVLNPSVKAFLALGANPAQRVVGDWDEWPARRPHKPVRKLMEMYLDRWLRRRAVLRVVASKYLQGQFKQRFDLDSAYIPYATYLQHFPESASPFAQPTAVYMGNFFPAYDHDLIFDAARILKEQRNQPHIQFLGSGPDLEKWRAFVHKHGLTNVSVPGFVTGQDLWRRLRHAHVLLFPIRENLLNLCRCPSKTFAYAQAKRPVITNRVGEIPYVLGEHAQYVQATPEAFASAIGQAMEQPALPDVDYGVECHNWSARTDVLMDALATVSPGFAVAARRVSSPAAAPGGGRP
jgi:glycosyltransferase involved in cell wall biosynthesis